MPVGGLEDVLELMMGEALAPTHDFGGRQREDPIDLYR